MNNARLILEEAEVTEKPTTIGVLRSYMTRHGAGPLPTEQQDMTRLLADPNNPCNNWQDNLRSGYLDMPLIRYALKVNGPVDSLALTHLDKVGNPWKVAYSYDRNILQAGKTGPVKLGKDLASVRYLTTRVKKKRFVSWLELTLETPVGITSEGPLFRDKKFHGAFAMA
jgi:adenylosuccinate synthase